MARVKRFHYPGYFYHVMHRGNHGQDIFFSDSDRHKMSFLLQEGIERYGHRIHAFCFMKNHIHLLVQIGNIPLAKVMHNLAFRYSQKINRNHATSGHLFQGRYKSILIQDGLYFTRLLRYIHRNPVRAGIVKDPRNYPWSSHNSYLDLNQISWVTKDFGLSKFGKTRVDAIRQYSMYISEIEQENELEELRNNFKDGHVLGDDDFLERVRNQNLIRVDRPLSIESIVKVVCDQFNIERRFLTSRDKSRKVSFARAVISKIAIEKGDISMTNLGKFFHRDQTTITGLVKNFEERYKAISSECPDIEFLAKLVCNQTP
jgi:putative transposase